MSAPTIKNGKKPIATKKNPYLNGGNVFGDVLYIDPELRAELDGKNLQPKWLDAQTTMANSGFDPEGWMVYKRDPRTSDTIGLSGLKFGQDPSGVVRRGSLILGVMDKEQHAHLQEALQVKSDRLSQSANSNTGAKELRKAAQQAQVDVKIHEGYEDNE